MMRKLLILTFAFALCVGASSAEAFGQDATRTGQMAADTKFPERAPKLARETKITGELVNLDCYVGQDLRGAKLTACSQQTANDQSRLALLSGGKLYMLVSDDNSLRLGEKLSDFAGKRMWLIGVRKAIDGGGSVLVVRGLRGELAR